MALNKVAEQFDDILALLNKFYDKRVEVDPFAAFGYNAGIDGNDDTTVWLYYNDESSEWIISVLHNDTLEEEVKYRSEEYSRVDLLTAFTNVRTALILWEE